MAGKPDERPDRDPWATAIEIAFREARADGLGIAAAADIVAQVLREKIDERAAEGITSPADVVDMQSVLSARSGQPLVQVRLGASQWQWTPEETREHALALLTTAEVAVHDAATYRWLTLSDMALNPDMAARAVLDLRRFRGDVDRSDWRENG